MKKQINIKVMKVPKRYTRWAVRVVEVDRLALRTMLPGDFKTWRAASIVAETLATYYRLSGYDIALDTKTCRKLGAK